MIAHADLLHYGWLHTGQALVYDGLHVGHERFPVHVALEDLAICGTSGRAELIQSALDFAGMQRDEWIERWSRVPPPDEWWHE